MSKAVEIRKDEINFNSDNGFGLAKAWDPDIKFDGFTITRFLRDNARVLPPLLISVHRQHYSGLNHSTEDTSS